MLSKPSNRLRAEKSMSLNRCRECCDVVAAVQSVPDPCGRNSSGVPTIQKFVDHLLQLRLVRLRSELGSLRQLRHMLLKPDKPFLERLHRQFGARNIEAWRHVERLQNLNIFL